MRKEIAKFLVLALLAVGAGPASAALWQWSQTPATNGNSDPTINWQVGMAPSAVDPSARAMMARMAEYRDDISGSLTTGGTSTAYTVTTNQANGSVGICNGGAGPPTNGQMISITPNANNGASPTLAVDTCTAAPLQITSGVAAPAGTLFSGTPYRIKYSTSNTAWMLADFYNLAANPLYVPVPLGAMIPYTLSTSPSANYVLPAGQCLSTATYATYWTLLGSPAPGSCSAGQFQIVDARSKTLVALDNLNGSSANILTSSGTGCGTAMTSVGATCANGSQSFTLGTGNLPPYTPSGGINFSAFTANSNNSSVSGGGSNSITTGGFSGSGAFSFTSVSATISFAGNAQGGSSVPVPNVQPTMAVGMLLRVL
jgi:hypothetical protein